ncbi:MAG: hypothetical protein ACM3Q1_00775 [Bacteroidales bacterium]
MSQPVNGSIIFSSDRMAAVRLALGAALAHPHTAALSNAELARQIGCGETTVRRYRKVAESIGLRGVISDDGTPAVCRVPDSLAGEAQSILYSLIDATDCESSDAAQKVNARARALLVLLDGKPCRETIVFVHKAALEMSDEDDWLY